MGSKRPTLLRDASPAELESVGPIIGTLARNFIDTMRAGEAEAETLLAAAGDDSDFPTLAAHLEAHPPSAAAIAHLVWRVRELTGDHLSRRSIPDGTVRRTFDALPKAKTLAALRDALELAGLTVPDDKHLREALKRIHRTPEPAKKGRRKVG